MAGVRDNMQKLMEMRERLQKQIAESERATEALRNELKGLEGAIFALGASPEDLEDAGHAGRPRQNVKQPTLDAIVEAGAKGVTAPEVVEWAKAKGLDLHQPSVSSLLSRLKKEETLTFNGERYFPKVPSKAASILSLVEAAGN